MPSLSPNSSSAGGLQIGAQSYGYAVFLMTDKAVRYVEETKGSEVGVGRTVVVVDAGVAKNLSTSSLKDDGRMMPMRLFSANKD